MTLDTIIASCRNKLGR